MKLDLRICRDCALLYDAAGTGRGQRCGCTQDERERGPGFDYNEHSRLCMCCVAEIRRSGSRWSVWFCDPCKQRILALNRRFGAAVIPMGRHSLMNGFAIQGDQAGSRDATAVFVRQMKGLMARINDLHEWMRVRLTFNLGVLDRAWIGDISVAEYLEVLQASSDPRLTKESAFEELRVFFEIPAS